MNSRRARAIVAAVAVSVAGAGPATAAERFFHDPAAAYGTQALLSPAWVLVNRGWDIIQCQVGRRDVFAFDYAANLANVWDNLLHMGSRIREYGRSKFVSHELLPLTFTRDTARWVPNYTLHLVGGGMTFRGLREWFEARDVPLAWLWSAATVMTAAFVNEALENDGPYHNTDAIADIVFFDLAAILLFSVDGLCRVARDVFHLRDWSLQPSATVPSARLHNVGNYFSVRVDIAGPLALFCVFGNGTLGGLAWRLPSGDTLSAGAGAYTSRLVAVRENNSNLNRIELAPAAGVYWDRHGSLMASVFFKDVVDSRWTVNVYPGVIGSGTWSPGLWLTVGKDGSTACGISASWTWGLGLGWESRGLRRLDP